MAHGSRESLEARSRVGRRRREDGGGGRQREGGGELVKQGAICKLLGIDPVFLDMPLASIAINSCHPNRGHFAYIWIIVSIQPRCFLETSAPAKWHPAETTLLPV